MKRMMKLTDLRALGATAMILGVSACSSSPEGTASVQEPIKAAHCTVYGVSYSDQGDQAGKFTECCNGADSPKIPSPEGCGGDPNQVVSSTMATASKAADVAHGSLQIAQANVGEKAVARNGESAATAGPVGGAAEQQLPGPEKVKGMDGPKVSGSGGDSGHSGGGSGSGGGALGGGAFGSGVSTAAAQTSGGAGAVLGDLPGSGYASGGAGAAKGSAASADFGSLMGGGQQGGRGGTDPAFGDGSRGLAASGSADPQDYFSRSKPADNLFKIVEKRYTDKAKNWALSDAQRTSDSVRKITK